MLGSIFDAYIGGEAAAFFPTHFADAAARRDAVAAALRPLAPEVAVALQAQNARLAPSPQRDAALQALAGGAAAVVTGQQVGLFGGPLFNYFKAATAIRMAELLQRETGTPVVPIFWLQCEDHDLPEIAHIGCIGSDAIPFEVAVRSAARQRISLAHCRLEDDVDDARELLQSTLAHLPFAEAHLQRLARLYRPGTGWTEAFAQLFGELFAEQGLVLVQPRDPAFDTCMRHVHEHALRHAEDIAVVLSARVDELAAAGWEAPVHVRPGSPLSFFHPEGAEGPRFRLAPSPGGGWSEVGGEGEHRRADVLAALAADPLVCSTSVLLRPIYQDLLLPTAAYVGGPGEIAYFAQLAPLYEHFGRRMPLIVPRARMRLVAARDRQTLARYGVTPAQLATDTHGLARLLAPPAEGDDLQRRLLAAFEAALAAAEPEILAAGPGLASALTKTRATVTSAVARLTEKVARAHVHAEALSLAELTRVQANLFPHGHPQERYFGLAPFAARFGEAEVLHHILYAIDPLDPTLYEVDLGDDGQRRGSVG